MNTDTPLQNRIAIVIVLGASLLIVLPALVWGVPFGNADLIHHLQIANTYFESIRQGVIQPDWNASENLGYGDVTVRFYPPLMHYTIAVFRILTGGWHLAVVAACALWSFAGALGVYLLSKDLTGDVRTSAIAAVIFLLTPYHLNQFYNSGMYGEYAALSLLPFCFLFARRVCERGDGRNVVFFGISIALLILSNIPQAVIGLMTVGFFGLLYLEKQKVFRQILGLATGSVIGLAASSFYSVRVVSEMQWINISQPNTDPMYDYRNHFLLSRFSFDDSGVWFATAFFLGSLIILATAIAASGRFREMRDNAALRNLLILSAFSILMIVPLSKPLWDNFEFIQKVQFPWRFLSVFSLGFSILFACTLGFLNAKNFRHARQVCLILIGLFLIFATFSIKQVVMGAVYIEPAASEKMVSESVPATGLWHWRPFWVDERAFTETEKVKAAGRSVTITRWEPGDILFTADAGETLHARVALMYYPHWRATVDGVPAAVELASDGASTIAVPAQNTTVELKFVEPRPTFVARQVSFWTWLAAFAMIALSFRRRAAPLS